MRAYRHAVAALHTSVGVPNSRVWQIAKTHFQDLKGADLDTKAVLFAATCINGDGWHARGVPCPGAKPKQSQCPSHA